MNNDKTVFSQCALSLPPENIRDRNVFRRQTKAALGTNGLNLKCNLILKPINSGN